MKTVRDRLYSRLQPDPETGCLLWQGCINSKGYGVISVSHTRQLVHRVAWTLDNGEIPCGLTIDHVHDRGCRHKTCVNVAHLEPVTLSDNVRRGHAHRDPSTYRGGPRPQPRNDPSPEYLAMLAEWLDPAATS